MVTAELPRWRVDSFFPSLDSHEYATAFATLTDSLKDLRSALTAAHSRSSQAEVETIVDGMNSCLAQAKLLRSFVGSFTSTDSRDELASARRSELAKPVTELSKLATLFTAWVGTLPLDELCSTSQLCKDHEFALKKAAFRATKLMSPEEESLASDLFDSGTGAWGRLHSQFTSQLEVPLNRKPHTMSEVRKLAYDPNPSVRKQAYEAEIRAWRSNALPIAQSMNSIKAQTSLISRRRGWGTLLDESMFAASVDKQSLEAMLDAAKDAFPMFRRYMRAKARCLGHKGGIPFYDLFAPIGEEADWSYGQAERFIVDKFESYSDKLADLARRSFREDWVDAGSRPGKEDGAFCMGMRKEESRILMNFKPSFGSVSTLAHELGHAYHNLCLADCTELQRSIPMTLAETASIFCETIIKREVLAEATGESRLGVLEAALQGSCQVVVDITSRYLFEKEVIERRESRELSESDLCDIMARAQLATYGDGLDPEYLHPYMWAAKPHYYSQRPYYNFPYMFGLLFSLGLYGYYESHPEGFQDRYDQLLAETGKSDAYDLGLRFGIDIRSKSFWAGSLKVIEQDVDQFVEMVS